MCTNTLQAEHAVAAARIGLQSLRAGIQRNQEGAVTGTRWGAHDQTHLKCTAFLKMWRDLREEIKLQSLLLQ